MNDPNIAADVLLWRKKHLSASTIVGAAILWVVFEWIGYHFVSVISFVLLVAIVFVFLWSYTADLLNRSLSLPPSFLTYSSVQGPGGPALFSTHARNNAISLVNPT